MQFVFYDRARPAADYRLTLPTWFGSPGDRHFYRRSSWRPDAVWTSIAGGTTHWAPHQMRGAGHIAIQRGDDYLLVNSGQWKGATGDFGSPQAFDLRSWRGNTLFVNDFGDYLFTDDNYRGGQGHWGTSSVLAEDGGTNFGYMKTDLTTAYSIGNRKPWASRSVRYFHRNFLSMGDGVVLVFDRMQFLKANYIKKLYFHLNPAGGPPAISGDTASIRAGAPHCSSARSCLPRRFSLAGRSRQRGRRPNDYIPPRGLGFRRERHVQRAERVGGHVLFHDLDAGNNPLAGDQRHDGWRHGERRPRSARRLVLGRRSATSQCGLRGNLRGRTGVHVVADLVANVQCLIARDGTSIGTIRRRARAC